MTADVTPTDTALANEARFVVAVAEALCREAAKDAS